jgi:hypothetical protein
MQFFDRQNSLSASGQLLAEMLMPSIEDRWSELCVLELTSKCGLYWGLLGGLPVKLLFACIVFGVAVLPSEFDSKLLELFL